MVYFAARLKQLRVQRGMTQAEVARNIGVTRSVISLYENDLRGVSPDVIISFSHLYGVTADYILGLDNRQMVDVTGLNEQEIAAILTLIDLFRTNKKER